MRIQSKFKDYYDYIGHKYGADPAVVYLRGPLRRDYGSTYFMVPWKHNGFHGPEDIFAPETRTVGSIFGKMLVPICRDIVYVVAGMTVYPIVRTDYGEGRSSAEPFSEPKHKPLFGKCVPWDFCRRSFRGRRGTVKDGPLDWSSYIPAAADLTTLVRAVGAPVFVVRPGIVDRELRIETAVPVLADIGFPAIVPPDQMWQAIYTTLTSVLRLDPDKAPPVEIGNEYKIHAAGFDLKTSFRHPVKGPLPKRTRRP